MKSLYIFIIFIFICTLSNAQTPSWAWARSAGGNSSDYANSMAVDASGNVYVAGTFSSSSITFGSIILTNPNYSTMSFFSSDMFIVKYDANGNVLWAKNAGSVYEYSTSDAKSVITDANGNVFVTGNYSYSFILDQDTLFGYRMFIAKYNTSGNLIWVKSPSIGSGSAYSVTTDASGNSYVTGTFSDTTITFGSTTLTNDTVGFSDIFIAKYDVNGNVLWAKSAGGNKYNQGTSITADSIGNIFITGYFNSDTITFGTIQLINDSVGIGISDLFIAKYDQNGNLIWAKSPSGTATGSGNSVCSDLNGNIYLTGGFSSLVGGTGATITFDTTTLTTLFGDMFLVKYNTSGNVLWAKSAVGGADYGSSVTSDILGNVYIAGLYMSQIAFDTIILTTPSMSDLFLVKYGTNGNVLWAKGCTNSEGRANAVATDGYGNIYLTGSFDSQSITFDFSTINNFWADDIFFAKISKCGSPQGIDICLVTVDTATSTKNYVIWEKPIGVPIDSFRVYRQISSQYVHIGSVPYSSLSEFVDTTNGINPKLTSYKYKISIVDTCGDEGPLSSYHQSMHFLVSPAIPTGFNLFWNDYVGFTFNQYIIWRDGNNTGNWQKLDSVSYGITTYTDLTPPTDSASYWIEAVHPAGCNITKAGGHNSTRSNVQRNYSISVPMLSLDNLNLIISPNPFSENTTLTIQNYHSSITSFQLSMYDVTGKLIRSEPIAQNVIASGSEAISSPHNQITTYPSGTRNDAQIIINRGNLKSGMYFIELRSDKIYRGKLIVQ